MTNKPVCSHVLASSAWTLKQAHNYIATCQETRLQLSACKVNSSPTELTSQTMPACIGYIIGVFCYNFNS